MNKYLIAMIAMLCGALLAMEEKEGATGASVRAVKTTFYDAYPQEDKDNIQQIITQLPQHLQEHFAWVYTLDQSSGRGPLYKKDQNITLCFFQHLNGRGKFEGLAHVVNSKLHWIIPIDKAVQDSQNLTFSMTVLDLIKDEESLGMFAVDCISKGLLVERSNQVLNDIITTEQRKLDEAGSKQELNRFISNPNNFCGHSLQDNITLKALEIAIKKGKFKYSKNKDAARKAVALQLLGVKFKKDAENAYANLVAVKSEWSERQVRAHYKKMKKYLTAIQLLRQIN